MAKPKSAGYSGTPLPRKLGIVEGTRMALLDTPAGFLETLGELPAGVACLRSIARGAAFDLVVAFVRSRAELAERFAPTTKRMLPAGAIWIAWPKKSSGVATDMTEDA